MSATTGQHDVAFTTAVVCKQYFCRRATAADTDIDRVAGTLASNSRPAYNIEPLVRGGEQIPWRYVTRP